MHVRATACQTLKVRVGLVLMAGVGGTSMACIDDCDDWAAGLVEGRSVWLQV